MSSMRRLARTVAHNKSYQKCGTTDMFQYFFAKLWREKGTSGSNRKKKLESLQETVQ